MWQVYKVVCALQSTLENMFQTNCYLCVVQRKNKTCFQYMKLNHVYAICGLVKDGGREVGVIRCEKTFVSIISAYKTPEPNRGHVSRPATIATDCEVPVWRLVRLQHLCFELVIEEASMRVNCGAVVAWKTMHCLLRQLFHDVWLWGPVLYNSFPLMDLCGEDFGTMISTEGYVNIPIAVYDHLITAIDDAMINMGVYLKIDELYIHALVKFYKMRKCESMCNPGIIRRLLNDAFVRNQFVDCTDVEVLCELFYSDVRFLE